MLKNYDLDFDNCITIKPTTAFNPDTRIITDAPLNKSHLKHGSATHSLGSSPVDITALQESLGTQGPFRFMEIVIKEPNSDDYNLPTQLEPLSDLITLAADHEYKNSPYAHQKMATAFIVFYPEVKLSTKFNGTTWHLDNFPLSPDIHEEYGTLCEHMDILQTASQTMLPSQVFYSSAHATSIQKKQLDKPHNGMGYMTANVYSLGISNPNFTVRQPEDHEAIAGLAPYHHSKDIHPSKITNEPRLLCVIFHAHTHESAEQFFRDNPDQNQDVTSWQQLRTYDPF